MRRRSFDASPCPACRTLRSLGLLASDHPAAQVTLLHGDGSWLRADGRRHTWEAHSPPWNHSALPFKYHAEHRHHIPKPRYRVTNWAEYDASLRRRGSLTVWFTDEAIQAWRAEPR